jgi:uncharacterized OsmC-like protein
MMKSLNRNNQLTHHKYKPMKIYARVNSSLHQNEILVQTDEDPKVMAIASKTSGYGSSVNGAELLLLSIATCFCNDIYREAKKRNIAVSEVKVECTGEFGKEGEPGSNFQYKAHVIADATAEETEDLIKYTDSVAEIHNTLRKGLSVTLTR